MVVVCACLLSAAALDGAANEVNPIGMSMERSHVDEYAPGDEILITISIAIADDSRVINAIGLRETIPPGWEFVGLSGSSASMPVIAPPEGHTDVLVFAWIVIPELPFTLGYTLKTPDSEPGGLQVIHGVLEYRLAGGAKFAPPIVTSLVGVVPENEPEICAIKQELSCGARRNRADGWGDLILVASLLLGLVVSSLSTNGNRGQS